MSGILTGQERSGSPLETRGGTSALAGDITGPGGGRIQAGATRGALGFDPSMLDIERVIMSLLADPADSTKGRFAALEPFEERQTEEAVAKGAPVFIRIDSPAAGQFFGGLRSDVDGGNAIQVLGAVFKSTLTAAGLAKVRVNRPA